MEKQIWYTSGGDLKMYKICFVEDEVDLQTVVKLYLEKAGY